MNRKYIYIKKKKRLIIIIYNILKSNIKEVLYIINFNFYFIFKYFKLF